MPENSTSAEQQLPASLLRQQLRQQIRQQRQQIMPHARELASRSAAQHLLQQSCFRRARRIAFYLPANGEIDCRLPLLQALRLGKAVYLPVVSTLSARHMHFVRVRNRQNLYANRWGIHQPRLRQQDIIHPMALDLVLVPLVGFDQRGNRLGMGKGYYDRAFAFRCKHSRMPRRHPQLVGLAYDWQQVASIPAQAWDVALDQVITPSGSSGTPHIK